MSNYNNEVKGKLNILYNDYCDGKGEYGPVHKEYSNMLNKFRHYYSAWKPFKGHNLDRHIELYCYRNNKALICAAILFVVNLFFYFQKVGVDLVVLGTIIAGVEGAFMKKFSIVKRQWPIFNSVALFVSSIIGLVFEAWGKNLYISMWLMHILVGCYAYSAYKEKISREKEIAQIEGIDRDIIINKNDAEKNLVYLSEKFKEIWTDLQNEFSTYKNQILSENNITEEMLPEDARKYCSILKETMWWQYDVQEIYDTEKQLHSIHDNEFEYTWETKPIVRDYYEFDCTEDEYYPMGDRDEAMAIYNANKEYTKNCRGGIIIDFISLLLASKPAVEVVKYKEYAHGDFKRLSMALDWRALGQRIDNDYRDGELLEEHYRRLRSEYNYKDYDVNQEINRMEEHEYEREYEAKSATFIWTGQVMLVPDPKVVDGYILVDYRCQYSHMLDNLNELKNYKITQVGLNGNIACDKFFLAKIHSLYSDCR